MSYLSCIGGVVKVVGDNSWWLNDGKEYLFDIMARLVLCVDVLVGSDDVGSSNGILGSKSGISINDFSRFCWNWTFWRCFLA